MYKLRIYKLSGIDKGNLDHEELFNTKDQMDKRYDELFKKNQSRIRKEKSVKIKI